MKNNLGSRHAHDKHRGEEHREIGEERRASLATPGGVVIQQNIDFYFVKSHDDRSSRRGTGLRTQPTLKSKPEAETGYCETLRQENQYLKEQLSLVMNQLEFYRKEAGQKEHTDMSENLDHDQHLRLSNNTERDRSKPQKTKPAFDIPNLRKCLMQKFTQMKMEKKKLEGQAGSNSRLSSKPGAITNPTSRKATMLNKSQGQGLHKSKNYGEGLSLLLERLADRKTSGAATHTPQTTQRDFLQLRKPSSPEKGANLNPQSRSASRNEQPSLPVRHIAQSPLRLNKPQSTPTRALLNKLAKSSHNVQQGQSTSSGLPLKPPSKQVPASSPYLRF